jgi:hypothetical protein
MIGRRRFEAKTREAVDSDLALVRSLFREYASEIQIDLGFQNFEAELASLPGPYAPPAGAILLAEGPHSEPLGVVAIRPLLGDTCEMKRLYIRPGNGGLNSKRPSSARSAEVAVPPAFCPSLRE